MPRKTKYLNIDQKLYDEIIGSVESFLKQHNARWKKSQDISTLCEGDKVLVNNNSVTITAEVTLDYYAQWAEFYNLATYGLCSLAACKLPNHYFNTNTTYGPNDGFRTSMTNINVNIGFVDESNINYTYRIKIDFKKG
jgi:hypothetical protein